MLFSPMISFCRSTKHLTAVEANVTILVGELRMHPRKPVADRTPFVVVIRRKNKQVVNDAIAYINCYVLREPCLSTLDNATGDERAAVVFGWQSWFPRDAGSEVHPLQEAHF
jgi:hypothetical protein